MKIRVCLSVLLFFFYFSGIAASDSYQNGLDDYREGRMESAVRHFETALLEDPSKDGACLYLGVLYQNMGNLMRAEEYFIRGKNMQGLYHNDLTFNLANLLFNGKRYDEAVSHYESLIQMPGKHRTSSLLNLANLSVQSASYQKAIDLYLEYLIEDPETPQRPEIEKMITMLKMTVDEQEQLRLAEEERLRQEAENARLRELDEKARLEEEARQRALAEQQRLEEEARQKALLQDILDSLSSSGQETENFTADSEEVKEDFEESDLDD